MAKHPIRWGILGTSFISGVMAEAIQQSQTSQLSAIGSRSTNKAAEFAKKFSIPTYYDNYQQLLNDKDIDAVYLGLPNHLHKEWIIQAAQAGKHVLCEKPFVISAAEAQEVISILEKTNVVCMEALMYRYHPFIKKLHELVNNKIIGDIKLYNATYTANIADIANPTAGGSIRNLGCYPISLVRLLANAEPIEMKALGKLDCNKNANQTSIILKFANDAIAVVSTADNLEMFWQFDLYGTLGSLKVTTNPWLPDCDHNKIIISLNNNTQEEINITAEKPLYTYQIDTMNTAIQSGDFHKHDGVSLVDSLGNISVLEKWHQQLNF